MSKYLVKILFSFWKTVKNSLSKRSIFYDEIWSPVVCKRITRSLVYKVWCTRKKHRWGGARSRFRRSAMCLLSRPDTRSFWNKCFVRHRPKSNTHYHTVTDETSYDPRPFVLSLSSPFPIRLWRAYTLTVWLYVICIRAETCIPAHKHTHTKPLTTPPFLCLVTCGRLFVLEILRHRYQTRPVERQQHYISAVGVSMGFPSTSVTDFKTDEVRKTKPVDGTLPFLAWFTLVQDFLPFVNESNHVA